MAVAFKIGKNRIHHVLEYLGACNRSVFGDVADQEYRGIGFGEALQFGGCFRDLADAA